MSDIQQPLASQVAKSNPGRSAGKIFIDYLSHSFFTVMALFFVVILIGVYIFIGSQSYQTFTAIPDVSTIRLSFFDFFVSSKYDGAQNFGSLFFLEGSFSLIVTTMVFAVPFSIFLAIFLAEISPSRLRGPLRGAVELFLGIPSIIFGLIGLLVVVPAIRDILNFFAGGKFFNGFGLIAATVVVTFMILPTITTISVDAIQAVPRDLREGSLALGATRWQTITRTVLPGALPGILTGVILGIARALGETVAVAFVIGGAFHAPIGLTNFYPYIYLGPTSVMTTDLLFNFKEAVPPSTLYNTLWTMCFVLLVFSGILVGISRAISSRRIYA